MTILDDQLAAIHAGDLDALMAQYHEDALMVRFDRTARGPGEIRELFTAYLAAKPELAEMRSLQEVDDVIFYNAVMKVGGNSLNTHGTLIIRDGKIWRQTAVASPL